MRLTMMAMLVLTITGAAAAQERSSAPAIALAPALLEQDGDYSAGLRVDLQAGSRRHELTLAYPRSRYWRVEGRGTVAIDPDLNPDPLTLGAAAGLAISLAKPRVITPDPERVDAPGTAMQFDYGDLSIGALGLLEMNQRRTEARVALNLELIYTHAHQSGLWPVLPSVYLTGGVGRSLASDVRASASVPETQAYVRIAAGAVWHLSADRAWMPGFVRPIWLHAQLDVYREDDGVERATSGSEPASVVFDGTRIALGASYRLLGVERRLVDEIFVRWTNGERPTLPAPRKAWMLGIVLAP